jgi:hypothetical protein
MAPPSKQERHMNRNEHIDCSELTIDELDTVNGGDNALLAAFNKGIVKGFTDAGGTVTCGPAGSDGVSQCSFHA